MRTENIHNVILSVVWVDRVPHFIRQNDKFTIVVENSNSDLLSSDLLSKMVPAKTYKIDSAPLVTFTKNDQELFSGNASCNVVYQNKLSHYVIESVKDDDLITLSITSDYHAKIVPIYAPEIHISTLV